MIDHPLTVLGGILPDRGTNLLHAFNYLQTEHFRNEVHLNLFLMLEKYWDVTGGILPRHTLVDHLERKGLDAARRILYEEVYDQATELHVTDEDFKQSCAALREIRAEQMTGEAITNSMEILDRGLEIKKGTTLKGAAEARRFLYDELGRIDHVESATVAPEGDVRREAKSFLDEYAARKRVGVTAGVYSGIADIDMTTAGFQNGELILICAYTGAGKSMLSTQTAWEAAIMAGKNVFLATSETIRETVRRRLYARHSRLPIFGLPDGLNSKKLKDATLTPDEEAIMHDVAMDLQTNPDYGRLYVAQIPRNGTLGFLEAKIARQQAQWNIDLVVIDYLALLHADRPRDSKREEFDDMLKDAKVMAATFAGGRGVPIISPWAMKQNAYQDALKTGGYTLASLSDTSEAEKSSDQIISLLRHPDQSDLRVQFLKNRDGETPPGFTLETDFRSTYIGSKSGASVEELFGGFE